MNSRMGLDGRIAPGSPPDRPCSPRCARRGGGTLTRGGARGDVVPQDEIRLYRVDLPLHGAAWPYSTDGRRRRRRGRRGMTVLTSALDPGGDAYAERRTAMLAKIAEL